MKAAFGLALALAGALAQRPLAGLTETSPVVVLNLNVGQEPNPGRARTLTAAIGLTAPYGTRFEIDPTQFDVTYRRVDRATAWQRIAPTTTKVFEPQQVERPRDATPIDAEASLTFASVPAVPGATYEFSVNAGAAIRFTGKSLPIRPSRIAARYVGVPAGAEGYAWDADAVRLRTAFASGYAVVRAPFGVICDTPPNSRVTLAAGTHVTFPKAPWLGPNAMFPRSGSALVVGTGRSGTHPLRPVDPSGLNGDGLFASTNPFQIGFTTTLPACSYGQFLFASADDVLRYLTPEAAPAATPPSAATPSAPASPGSRSSAPPSPATPSPESTP